MTRALLALALTLLATPAARADLPPPPPPPPPPGAVEPTLAVVALALTAALILAGAWISRRIRLRVAPHG